MSKSKMAVRNRSREKSFQLDLDFGLASKTKKILPYLLISLLIAGLSFLVIKSKTLWNELLPINEIVLQGETKFLKHQDIIEFMQQQSASGLLAIDLEELQKKAKKIEWVKAVEIRKVWPEKLLFVVEEHHPVAVFDNIILTEQGTLINVKDKELLMHQQINELPKVAFEEEKAKVDDEYNFIWKEFKQMKRSFEIVNLNLNNLHVDNTNNWRLNFPNEVSITLGRKERLDRVERLVKVYQLIENKMEIKSIDLRYHNGFAIEWNEKKV